MSTAKTCKDSLKLTTKEVGDVARKYLAAVETSLGRLDEQRDAVENLVDTADFEKQVKKLKEQVSKGGEGKGVEGRF